MRSVFFALTSTLLAGTAFAQEATVLHTWDFDHAADVQQWRAENNTEVEAGDGGTLVVRNTGFDPHMSTTAPALRAEEVTHVTIRLRASHPGSSQIYFTTDEFPNPGENGIATFSVPPGDAWHEVTVSMGTVKNWRGELRYFRIDPINGGMGENGGVVEIDEIRLEQRPTRLVPVDASIEPWGGGDPMLRVEAWIENWGLLGTSDEIAGVVTSDVGAAQFEPDRHRWLLSGTVADGSTGVSHVATVEGLDGALAEYHGLRLAGSPDDHRPEPGGVELIGDVLALEIVTDAEGSAIAGVLWGRSNAEWRNLGTVAPLASVSFQAPGETPVFTPVAFDEVDVSGDSIELEADVQGLGEVELELRLRGTETAPKGALASADAAELVEWRLTLEADDAVDVNRLAGPSLLAGLGSFGGSKDGGVFPGVEYLSANEPSSGTEANAPQHGERWSPRSFHITVPIMAVEAGGFLVGQMWDATQEWRPGAALPAAEFASPDFLGATEEAHRMGLFVPMQDELGQQNLRTGLRPERLGDGEEMTLSGALFAASGAQMVDAVPLWYAVHGLPEAVELVKEPSEFMDDLMEGWATTLYFPEVDGFTNHWRFNQTPGPNGAIKSRVLDQAMRTTNWEWAKLVGMDEGTKMTELNPPLQPGAPAPPQRARIGADGSVPYEASDFVKERTLQFTDGRTDSLGRAGESNSGLIAYELIHVAGHALSTGDPESVDVLLRGLEAIEHYSVPRGSQVWEVHMDAPDIFASTNIMKCHMAAYELTGDRAHIDRAVHWAYTGLPFLYSYRVPGRGPVPIVVVPDDAQTEEQDYFSGVQKAEDAFEEPRREMNPYGSIPVFGTSYYIVGWFGNVVQWCGLTWAQQVFDLLEYVDDPVLERAAEGVMKSGMHQTFDKAPIVGLLPDVWAMENYTATGAYIGPDPVEEAMRRYYLQPNPSWITTRVVHTQDGRIHVSARGKVDRAEFREDRLVFDVMFTPGALCDALVVGLPGEAGTVTVDGRALTRDESQQEHWRTSDGAVMIRFRVGEKGAARVVVE